MHAGVLHHDRHHRCDNLIERLPRGLNEALTSNALFPARADNNVGDIFVVEQHHGPVLHIQKRRQHVKHVR
jgi:hypothetical protein